MKITVFGAGLVGSAIIKDLAHEAQLTVVDFNQQALEHTFDSIKAGDVVNVGMHRGETEMMVEENAAIVSKILSNA